MQYTFVSPLVVVMPRKTMKDKRRYLNLNNYRNWNYIISNNIKKAYTELMEKKYLRAFKQLKKVKIEYYLYKRNRRHSDLNNIVTVVDKFFQDYLVKANVIEDDTTEFVTETHNYYKGLDENKEGYIKIVVTEIN